MPGEAQQKATSASRWEGWGKHLSWILDTAGVQQAVAPTASPPPWSPSRCPLQMGEVRCGEEAELRATTPPGSGPARPSLVELCSSVGKPRCCGTQGWPRDTAVEVYSIIFTVGPPTVAGGDGWSPSGLAPLWQLGCLSPPCPGRGLHICSPQPPAKFSDWLLLSSPRGWPPSVLACPFIPSVTSCCHRDALPGPCPALGSTC